jgi:hypothetical protein
MIETAARVAASFEKITSVQSPGIRQSIKLRMIMKLENERWKI